jgi:hypothetical protein
MAKATKANVSSKGAKSSGKGKKAANVSAAPDNFSIPDAIDALRAANASGDRQLGKKLRRQLRAHGHRGGLRVVTPA